MSPRDVSTVLDQARAGLSPWAGDQDRVRRSLEATLVAAEALPPSDPPPVGWITRGARWTSRLLVASALTASAGGFGYWAGYRAGRRDLGGATPLVVSAPARPVVTPASPPVKRGPSVVPASPRTVRDAHIPRSVLPSTAVARLKETAPASLDAEVRALRSVERALRDHEPGLALELLRELDRAVPDGKLLEEREATAAIARCALGDVPFGVAPARDFADRHPDSVYLERVTQGCAATAERNGHRP